MKLCIALDLPTKKENLKLSKKNTVNMQKIYG